MTADGWLADTRTSYDTVAVSYADQLRDALAGKPYARATLTLFADLVHTAGGGPVADVGCGPGHVTAYLRALGIDAFGIDLSPAMVDVARRDHPGLRFEVGSMTDLDLADASVAGLLAFWSLIHVPDSEVPKVFQHFRRVLRPGGPLLLGFHAGDMSRPRRVRGRGGAGAVGQRPRPRAGGLSPVRRSGRHTCDTRGRDRAVPLPFLPGDGVGPVGLVSPGTQAAVPLARPRQGPPDAPDGGGPWTCPGGPRDPAR